MNRSYPLQNGIHQSTLSHPLRIFPLGLAALLAAGTLNLHADTLVSSNTTQNGGTFNVDDDSVLLITDPTNDPTLTLTNGATASWQGATIVGNLDGESGNLDILGGGSVSNTGSGSLGSYGDVNVFHGQGFLGLNAGSSGTAVVSGINSQWINGSFLSVGHFGAGALRIEAGGAVSNGDGRIGFNSGSEGLVTVSGANSQWTNSSLSVGFGELRIEDGGAVSATNSTIRDGGFVTVSGANSQWTNSAALNVGHRSVGELRIEGGGVVSNGNGYIGEGFWISGPGEGLVTVSGANSQWINSGMLEIGRDGFGELIIEDGGTVFTGFDSTIGSSPGDSKGLVTVTGTNAHWITNRYFSVVGGGELHIKDGGAVSTVRNSQIDHNGLVTVSGANSQWTSEELAIGLNMFDQPDIPDVAKLSIEAGGAVSSMRSYIAYGNGSQGLVTVSGENSQWTNDYDLYVGYVGVGELRIEAGGTVSNMGGDIAHNPGAKGLVTVSGANSQWINSYGLRIGGTAWQSYPAGTGMLIIADSGQVTVGNVAQVFSDSGIHLQVSNSGMLQVDGDLTNDGLLRLAASPLLEAGVYTPLQLNGNLSGAGEIRAIGGIIWDTNNPEFFVATSIAAASGGPVQIDITTNQRLEVTGAQGSVIVALQAQAEAAGGGPLIEFTVTENSTQSIAGQEVLAAWDFETDLAFGTEIQLSLEIGAGHDRDALRVWHSEDGSFWTESVYENGLFFYEDQYASFFVEGFSSYAVSIVPEPSAVVLLLVSAAGLGLRRRRNQPTL